MSVKGKILFDLGHGEDRLDALMSRLPEEGFLYDITEEMPLKLDKLRQYTALVINNPSLTFSREEQFEIQSFVSEGGGIYVLDNVNNLSCYLLLDSFLNIEKFHHDFWGNIPLLQKNIDDTDRNQIYCESISYINKLREICSSEIKTLMHPTTYNVKHLYPKNDEINSIIPFFLSSDVNDFTRIVYRELTDLCINY